MAIGHHPLRAYQIGARGSSHCWGSFSVHSCGSRGLREPLIKLFSERSREPLKSIVQFLPSSSSLLCTLVCVAAAAVVMEFTSKKKALIVLCFMLSCLLLLPRASSPAPLSRSLSLITNSQQPSDIPALEVPAHAQQDEGAVLGAGNLQGEVAARMDIEVNDYPGSGANNRHEPRSPGRP